jgi:hypothetical protein
MDHPTRSPSVAFALGVAVLYLAVLFGIPALLYWLLSLAFGR